VVALVGFENPAADHSGRYSGKGKINLKALVSGGAGFIGSHLVDALLKEGFEVVVLDSLEPRIHPGGKPIFLNPKAQFVRGDVRNKADWIQALSGVEVVFHEAAYQDYMPDYGKFFHTNVVGTALLFEVIREQGLKIRKIVVASSQAVYGEGQYECEKHGRMLPPARSRVQMEQGDWELRCPTCQSPLGSSLLREEFTNPFNQYAVSKYSQELAALRLGRLLDLPTVALRYSITQGPRQSPFNAYSGVCRIFTLRLMNDEPPIVYEDGKQLRDYVHISDVVAANLFVLKESKADFDVFNVGSGVGTTVLEYARLLGEAIGKNIEPVVPGKYRQGDNRHSVSSIEKLKALGWVPRKTLVNIMDDYVEWYQSSGIAGKFYLNAEKEMERSGVVLSRK
jgi:dTDP-L-rhamnose 4-epimerase